MCIINDNKFKVFPLILPQCSALEELRALHSFSYFSREYLLPQEITALTTLKRLHYTRHYNEFIPLVKPLTNLEELSISYSTDHQRLDHDLGVIQKALPNCAVTRNHELFFSQL